MIRMTAVMVALLLANIVSALPLIRTNASLQPSQATDDRITQLTQHESVGGIECWAHYGAEVGAMTCCGGAHANNLRGKTHTCPASRPECHNYVSGKQWGT